MTNIASKVHLAKKMTIYVEFLLDKGISMEVEVMEIEEMEQFDEGYHRLHYGWVLSTKQIERLEFEDEVDHV